MDGKLKEWKVSLLSPKKERKIKCDESSDIPPLGSGMGFVVLFPQHDGISEI